jgi:lipopolysaccharide/colanic/teichoic acid biosynthesis glycosyltransferase
MVSKAVAFVRSCLGSEQEPFLVGMQSASQFRNGLERERACSDRSGIVFSLLVFAWRDGKARREGLRPLARILARRLRATDEYGWVDRDRVGAILRTAAGPEATKVTAHILAAYPAGLPRVTVEVYTYPSDTFLTPGPPRRVEQEPGRLRVPVPAAQRLRVAPEVALPMERFFARPLPRWKRGIDLAGAIVGLVVTVPLVALAAVLIRLTSRGPVLFRQRRGGLGGEPFVMYKLRTMFADAESMKGELRPSNEQAGAAFKMEHDPRITPVGRILRRTSIDELPQLWNVLIGDMSLVGPRPLPCDDSTEYDAWHRRRLDVTPGLTCIWQVSGRSRIPFTDWMRMDLRYVRERTPAVDLKLLLRTVPAVVLRKGAY